MPVEEFAAWLKRERSWHADRHTVVPVVLAPIVVVVLQARAHFKHEVGCDRDVAKVEEPVHIRSQQDAVACVMGTALTERPDVCRLENRQRVLMGDSACTVIGSNDR